MLYEYLIGLSIGIIVALLYVLFSNKVCVHKYTIKSDTGITQYKECSKCGKRIIVQQRSGYQPVNWSWIKVNYDKN